MLILLSQLCGPEVGARFPLVDVWFEPSSWQIQYFLLKAREGMIPMRHSLCQCSENAFDVKVSDDLVSRLDTVKTLEEFTQDREAKTLEILGVSQRGLSFDTEHEHLDLGTLRAVPSLLAQSALSRWTVESTTGVMGTICDLVLDASSHQISYFLSTDIKLSDRKVLIDPEWVESLDFASSIMTLNLSRETILLEAVYHSTATAEKKYRLGV